MHKSHKQKIKELPLVSVCVCTYQHRDYIKKCLDSILMQKTKFVYEICIGEDESLDSTREICVDYAKQHPDRIRLFLRQRKDVIYVSGAPTGRYNLIETFKQCQGKYIALCEGDDYWTDSLKLQKQVDFLENNEAYAGCQHKTLIRVEDGTDSANHVQFCDHEELSLHDVLARNFFSAGGYSISRTHTSSLLFRRGIVENGFPSEFYESSQGDHFLYVLITIQGKIKVLPEVMSVYRRHGCGLSAKIGLGNFPDKEKRRDEFLHMYDLFQKIVPQEYFREIDDIKKGLRLFFELEDARRTFKQRSEDMALKHAVWVWKHYVQEQYSEIALWGAGSHTEKLLKALEEDGLHLPHIIFDRAPKDTTLHGVPVKIPGLADRVLFDAIALSSLVFQASMTEDAHETFGRDIVCIDLYEGYLDTQDITNRELAQKI